jgi:uncharacterized membrane protein YqjE
MFMASATERPITAILHDIVSDVQEIIRSEIRLAKVELGEQASKAGKAAGMLAAGAVLGLYALGFLLLAGVYALATVWPSWVAALVICLLCGGIASALVVTGRKRIKQVQAKPDRTIATVKENLEWAKNQNK